MWERALWRRALPGAQQAPACCRAPDCGPGDAGKWTRGRLRARHYRKSRCHCLIVRRLVYKILVWTGGRADCVHRVVGGSSGEVETANQRPGERTGSAPGCPSRRPPSCRPATLRPARRRPCVGCPGQRPRQTLQTTVCAFLQLFLRTQCGYQCHTCGGQILCMFS